MVQSNIKAHYERKKMKSQRFYLIVISSIFFLFFNSNNVHGETNNQLNIETDPIPDSYLFELSNLKPGDRAIRKLTIKNLGEQDFTYNTQAEFKGGDEKLYDEFTLKISDSNGVIHEGKLNEFNGLAPRFLKSMNEEDLLFEAGFPYELGNDFQGLGFKVEFRFIVEGYDPPPPDEPDDPSDPNDPDSPDSSNNPEDPNKPNNPDNLEDPNNPDSPTNPQEPTNPTEPHDPDKINPQHPIDPEKLNSPPVDGQILPSTSTNIFNFVLGGIVLIVVGGILFFLQRKRNTITYQ